MPGVEIPKRPSNCFYRWSGKQGFLSENFELFAASIGSVAVSTVSFGVSELFKKLRIFYSDSSPVIESLIKSGLMHSKSVLGSWSAAIFVIYCGRVFL